MATGPQVKTYQNWGTVTVAGGLTVYTYYDHDIPALMGFGNSATPYSMGVPMPGGHNRFTVRAANLSGAVTYILAVDLTGNGTWTDLDAGLTTELVTFGEGTVLGNSDGTKFFACTVRGFRLTFSGPTNNTTFEVTGTSVPSGARP